MSEEVSGADAVQMQMTEFVFAQKIRGEKSVVISIIPPYTQVPKYHLPA